MTSGVNELEAFIAALRLSALISSTGSGSSESLQQGIAAFRETLRPQRIAATGSASTEEYATKQDDSHHSSASVFTQAGERISSTSTVWSSDDGIDRTKPIGLVTTVAEVREGTSEIRDLIQSMNELREEIVDLRAALAASNNVVPGSALPSTASRPQPPSSAAPSESNPNFTSLISSFNASKASLATEVPTLPPAPALLQALSSTPCLTTSLGPAYPPIAVPMGLVCPSEPISPVTEGIPELVLPKSNDPKPPSSNARMNDCTSQPLIGESVAKEMEDKTCVSDGENQQVVEAQRSEGTTKCRPKFLGTATVVQNVYTINEGEIDLERGNKITILDFADTPEGWLYGEITETRRGIFPARYVKEIQHPDVQKMLEDEDDSEYSEITEPGPGSAVIMASVSSFRTSRSGELDFGRGTRIMVVDAPNTPGGWLYGEIVEKRRGLFLARYVTLDEH
ncbi:hypothetical protein FRC00_002180 [Tulasnella sp. 408]|nr:hypothetical protein FRC00_002180 [Tulasnella sp. 408]